MKKIIIAFLVVTTGNITLKASNQPSCCALGNASAPTPLYNFLQGFANIIEASGQEFPQPGDNAENNIGTRLQNTVNTYLSTNKNPCVTGTCDCAEIFCGQIGFLYLVTNNCSLYPETTTATACKQAFEAVKNNATTICQQTYGNSCSQTGTQAQQNQMPTAPKAQALHKTGLKNK